LHIPQHYDIGFRGTIQTEKPPLLFISGPSNSFHYGILAKPVLINWCHDSSPYVHLTGTLAFEPGQDVASFPIEIIDDDIFEEDEHFYVKLSNLRPGKGGTGKCLFTGNLCI